MKYVIVATDRKTGNRKPIFGPTEDYNITHWTPSALNKKQYKYFKVAKHPYKPKK